MDGISNICMGCLKHGMSEIYMRYLKYVWAILYMYGLSNICMRYLKYA